MERFSRSSFIPSASFLPSQLLHYGAYLLALAADGWLMKLICFTFHWFANVGYQTLLNLDASRVGPGDKIWNSVWRAASFNRIPLVARRLFLPPSLPSYLTYVWCCTTTASLPSLCIAVTVASDSYDMGEDCTRDLDLQQLIRHSPGVLVSTGGGSKVRRLTMRFPFDLAALAVFIPPFARQRNPFITRQHRHSPVFIDLQFFLPISLRLLTPTVWNFIL